ncbi:MAG: hypothetical protein AABY10_01085 [Nanoarchaeota archaeon]
MLNYNDLYEILRKEKYTENLQPLTDKFLLEFKEYIGDKKSSSDIESNLFDKTDSKSKKQLENAISIFKEILLKRKKKILNLVFVAAETGIMKKDYENMISIEKKLFDSLVKIVEEGDKSVYKILHEDKEKKEENKLILLKQDLDQFVDLKGNLMGPYKANNLLNIEAEIANILVAEKKAVYIEENH